VSDKTYGENTTTEEILEGVDLRGVSALVTGASGGLGLETARALAAHGASVTLAARDVTRLHEAARAISASTGNAAVDCLELDLASLAAVRTAAARFADTHGSLNLLINNAGVMASPLMRSADGHEMQFAVCHLGHFLFTCLLVPLLRAGAPARVVNLSSAGHKMSPVLFDDTDFLTQPYEKWVAYGQAKTANVLFSVELSKRLGRYGISSNAVHPGAIGNTDLGRHLEPADMKALMQRTGSSEGFRFKSLEAGAATTVWAATASELEGRGGLYLEDCHVAQANDDPARYFGGYRSYATDPAQAQRLWSLTEEIVGERFDWNDDA
jgi:NAD(P)-dependent dehydrogenase (short-subunit alcohol dehydrogenase family)